MKLDDVRLDYITCIQTDGTVVDAAEPGVVLADDVPRLSGEVARHCSLVAVTSHPRPSRYHRVSAADRC